MKIATYNINSIRARLPNLLDWLERESPDVVLLQELKCQDDQFPHMDINALGYTAYTHGQKSYNGVAIITKHDAHDIRLGLPYDHTDTQARYIEATIASIRFCGLYLPNGNPMSSDKFTFKLAWMHRLQRHMMDTLGHSPLPVVLGGDWNVIPRDIDCLNPQDWMDDAAMDSRVRTLFQSYQNIGFYEVFSTLYPDTPHAFTFWDYQRGAWQKDNGIRIDHFLVSPSLINKVQKCWVDKHSRGLEKASDHTPLFMDVQL